MEQNTSAGGMHDTTKKLGALARVLLAFALVVTLMPTPTALAKDSTSQEHLLGLKVEQSNSPQGVIEGIVFVDENANGTYEPGEPLVSECEVTYGALEDKTSTYASVKTNNEGAFKFAEVADGTYAVRVVSQTIKSETYLSTLGQDKTDPIEKSVTLETPAEEPEPEATPEPEPEPVAEPEPEIIPEPAGVQEEIAEVNEAGLAQVAGALGESSISGIVWFDKNNDGLRDEGESGIEEYPVALYQNDEVVLSTVTDSSGAFSFTELPAGEYQVGVQAQNLNGTEYLIPMKTLQTGTDNAFDACFDLDPIASLSETITLEEKTDVADINAGMRGEQQIAPMAATGAYVVTGDTTTTNYGAFDTLGEAVTACVTSEPCTITLMANDPDMGGGSSPMVTPGQKVTLTSGPGGPYTIVRNEPGRHINVSIGGSLLTIGNVILQGGSWTSGNNVNGGVHSAGTLVLNGGVIRDCWGGGVWTEMESFTMYGGSIVNNQGGGVHARLSSTFTMYGGTISGNVATGGSGGGVYIDGQYPSTSFLMYGGTISNNSATSGGGIFSSSKTANAVAIAAGAKVINNTASRHGGGIWAADYAKDNPADASVDFLSLYIQPGADVSGNTAGRTLPYPSNWADFTDFNGKLIDNDNIVYQMNLATYMANNSTAGRYDDPIAYTNGSYATLKSFSDTALSAEQGYEFDYWSLNPDGSGTKYYPGQTFRMYVADGGVILYAIYKERNANVDVKYYFEGTHDSSLDDVIIKPYSTNITESDVFLSSPPLGYVIDPTTPTNPALPQTAGALESAPIEVYYRALYTVTEHYVDREGNSIGLPDTTKSITSGQPYTGGSAPTQTGYVFAGDAYTAPSGSSPSQTVSGNVPSLSSVTTNTDVYYVYGRDAGGSQAPGVGGGGTVPDSIEDIDVERQWVTISGGSYVPIPSTSTDTQIVNIGNGFALGEADAPAPASSALSNYNYKGYLTDQNLITDTLQSGTPSITASVTDGKRTIYYVYEGRSYTVTYHIVDRNGAAITGITAPAAETKSFGDSFGPVAPPNGASVEKTYVGWNTDGSGNPTNSGVITDTVAGNTDVYLVYGADANKNGTEDVQVTRHHIKATDGSALTGNLAPATITVDLPATYADAENGVTESGWTYGGWNTTGLYGSSDYTAGAPSITLTAGTNVDVYYVYTQDQYSVTYHAVDRTGSSVSSIAAPNAENGLTHGSAFGPVTPSPFPYDYVYIGWNTDNSGTTTFGPVTGFVTGNTDVYLVYGQDKDHDGKEDVTITRHHIKATDGSALTGNLSPTVKYHNVINSPYNDAESGVVEPGWSYAGWNTNGSTSFTPGAPSVPLTGGTNVDVYYVYAQTLYTITYHVEDRGTNLVSLPPAPAPETNKTYGIGYGVAAPGAPSTKIYVGWKEGASGTIQSGNPAGTVTGNKDIYLVYGDDTNNNGSEDVQVTRNFIKATDGTALTGNLSPATVTVDLPATYSTAETGVVESGWTYGGWNTDGSTSYAAGAPSLTLAAGNVYNVYYVYTQDQYTVTYYIEDRGLNTVTLPNAPSPETNRIYGSGYSAPVPPTPSTKVYVGFKEGSSGTIQLGNPSGTVTGNMDIYLVYGDDTNNNGAEDVQVTRHFVGDDGASGTPLTGNLTPSTVTVDLASSPYTISETGVSELGWSYMGWNETGSITSYFPGPPLITLVEGNSYDVYYIYGKSSHTVTYHMEDRGTNSIVLPSAPAPETKTYGATYNVTAPPAPQYKVYVGFREGLSGTIQTGNPSGTVTGNMDIYLIYGDDRNDNSTEDVQVTRHFMGVDGTALTGDPAITPATITVDLPATYTTASANIVDVSWQYAGYNTDGSFVPVSNTAPNIPLVAGTDVDVYYLYSQLDYTVYYHIIDRGSNVATIPGIPSETGKFTGNSYGATAPTAPSGKLFLGWTYDSSLVTPLNASPTISGTIVSSDVHVYLVYGDDSNGNGLEDVQVTRHHIKATDGTNLTGTLTPATATVDLPTYAVAQTGVLEPGWTYGGYNTTGATTYTPGDPFITLTPGNDIDVYYVYVLSEYTVTYHMEDRGTNSVALPAAPAPQTNLNYNATYGATAPTAPAGKVYVGFKEGSSGTIQTGNPAGTVTGNMDIYLVYGDDRDGSGTEDVQVTRHFMGTDTTPLTGNLTPTTVIVDLPASYTTAETGIVELGWNYAGYNTDGSTTYVAGAPNVTLSAGTDVDVYYLYTKANYTVNYHIVDKTGATITSIATPAPETNKTYGTTYNLSAAPAGGSHGRVYLGWNTDNLGGTNTAAITGIVNGNTDVYLVYGQDKGGGVTPGPDGIEDATITVAHETGLGTKIVADQEVYINLGDTFTGNSLTNLAYTLTDTKWDGTSVGLTANYVEPLIATDHTLVFVYTGNMYSVTVSYAHKDGTTLSGPNQNTSILHGSVFVPTIPSLSDLCLVDWKLNGVSQGNAAPLVAVTQFANIVLVYGQDKNGDGKEDVTITEECFCTSGTYLHGPNKVIVNVGDSYQCAPRDNAGHTYVSHKIDGGSVKTGKPSIANVQANAKVELTYEHNTHSVTVKHVDTSGVSIASNDYSQSVAYQAAWSAPAGAIQGYDYQGFKVGNGSLQSGNPSITSVTNDTTVNLVYKAKATKPSNPHDDTGQNPDPHNYNFVKTPNVKNVAAGEWVTYTFANFGNAWGVELERYSISDKPDMGLDFKNASLPAFNKGEGVTYDILYWTNMSGERTMHANVSAASPFYFEAPALAAGEYIMSITLEFGTVPAGFALGDTMQMTFKVWDNPPMQTLTNVGILGYKAGGEYKEFVTGTGSVSIGGWFTPGLAKMGDTLLIWVALLVALACTAGGVLYLTRRRIRNSRK